jgi:uncharacterized membrane protein YbhN (UPF0104 family)
MIIDIKRTILRQNVSSFIATIVFILVIVLLLFVPFSNNLIKGLDNNQLAVTMIIVYIVYALFRSLRQFNYIYFNDESDKIVLRYFSPSLFTSKKNSIEIPRKEFAGYTLQSFFMGYREKLILQRRTPKGIASYPPVSITALSYKEKHDLLLSLEKLKQKKG